ncbi:dual specificity protein phosphatase 13 isoform X4 [Pontoporia blainvillei]|uniref:Dual specificity protein phosphatase 13 isoform X4 n=1 Tax=Pontoporia blainvillei TaxID=48723 RepID=A0ABX0S5J8_PONBL|nr:dual specificity protein phosphatase 13 isoform X4 [Pontoporia blainvillei]
MAEASLPQPRGDAEVTPCPSVLELEELLREGKFSSSCVDEVWPNLYIGDAATANNRFELWKLGITHVLNAAHGGLYCQGSPDFYGSTVSYLGVPAHDLPEFDISAYFSSAADFIHRALSTPGGLCRFATLALALLVMLEALAQVGTQKLLCRVSDPLSQLTPDTSHPTWVRPDLQHWPESCRMDSLQKQDLRRPKIHGAVRVPPYQPPTLASLQRLLWVRRAAELSHINEVWPNLFLGDAYAARDKNKLTQLGITHIVNVAAGKFQVDTGANFYRGMPLEYYGIEADDNPFFDLSVYFLPVARYIQSALSIPQGRVLVHCAMGVSRSATVVLAFLMICENMTLVEAIQTVQAHRDICPNSGFLRQLQVLDNRLGQETGRL